MNRKELQTLAETRLAEAQVLLKARKYSGAYYLAGYAIECAFKACIAKQFRRYEFPDKKRVNDSYTHDLRALAKLSNINQSLLAQASSDPGFQANWDLVTLWSEKSRYETADRAKAKALVDAIMDTTSGVMPWITQHW
jgi:HEPN domain-containing protein